MAVNETDVVLKYTLAKRYLAEIIKDEFDLMVTGGKPCHSRAYIDCLYLKLVSLSNQLTLNIFDDLTEEMYNQIIEVIPPDYSSNVGTDPDVVTPGSNYPIFRADLTFLQLLDTPESYMGQAYKKVVVKPDETGLWFIDDSIPHERFTATEGQISFVLAGRINNNNIKVYINGVYISDTTQYTAPNGSIVTFIEPLHAGDIVVVVVDGALAGEVEPPVDDNSVFEYILPFKLA